MKNYVKKADIITIVSPTGGTVSGGAYLIGAALFGIAVTDSVAGDYVEMKRTGLYIDQPKATGAAWAAGDIIYWDNTAKNFTKTSNSNTRVGVAVDVAQSADTLAPVLIGPAIG